MSKDSTTFNEDFSRWYQALELGSETQARDARFGGVQVLVAKASAADVEPLVRIAFKSRQTPGSEELARVRGHLNAGDETFPEQGNDRELQLMCGAALAELCRSDRDVSALAALAVSIASTGARQHVLPVELAGAAEAGIARLSETRRQRPERLGAKTFEASKAEFEKVTAGMKAQDVPNAIAAIQLLVQTSQAAFASISKKLASAFEATHNFIAIQDEELQMLWWLVGERSWEFDRPFGEVPREQRSLVLAKELADLTTVLPGPTAIAALLSRVPIKDADELSIVAAVNSCDEAWVRKLVDGMTPSPVTTPIHFAMARMLETGEGSAWVSGWAAATGIDGNKKFSALQLGLLFYRERLLVLLPGMSP